MKKIILLLGTTFCSFLSYSYIDEDNEYKPDPNAKEIVIYDSGETTQSTETSRIYSKKVSNIDDIPVNIRDIYEIKNRGISLTKVIKNVYAKTYKNLYFLNYENENFGERSVYLMDNKTKKAFELYVVYKPNISLDSYEKINTNEYYDSKTKTTVKVVKISRDDYYVIYRLNSQDEEYNNEVKQLYNDIIKSLY